MNRKIEIKKKREEKDTLLRRAFPAPLTTVAAISDHHQSSPSSSPRNPEATIHKTPTATAKNHDPSPPPRNTHNHRKPQNRTTPPPLTTTTHSPTQQPDEQQPSSPPPQTTITFTNNDHKTTMIPFFTRFCFGFSLSPNLAGELTLSLSDLLLSLFLFFAPSAATINFDRNTDQPPSILPFFFTSLSPRSSSLSSKIPHRSSHQNRSSPFSLSSLRTLSLAKRR